MKFSGKTDVGMKRKTNQDSYAVFSREGYFCAIVCDGMGGAKGGNVASGLAVKTFATVVKKAFSANSADLFEESDVKELLKKGCREANEIIFRRAQNDEELEGMGTTLVAVVSCLCGTFAVNVGDSRLYCLDNDVFSQVTVDHSFVQYLLEKGEITEKEAASHPNRNIILRALGVNDSAECDIYRINSFDMLLLCTDGLTNHLDNERITQIITASDSKEARHISYKARVDRLIDEANRNGGSDNITAVLVGSE